MQKQILVMAVVFLYAFAALSGESPNIDPANTVPGDSLKFDPNFQKMIDGWEQGAPTNGALCAVQWVKSSPGLPQFCVEIINTTTNVVRRCLNFSFSHRCRIELQDAHGEAVEMTPLAGEFKIWTGDEIKTWLKARPREADFEILPLDASQVSQVLGLGSLFRIKEPGEYTLRVQTALVKRKPTSSGELDFEWLWLPEVAAKIQIRPEDLAAGRTNAPAQ